MCVSSPAGWWCGWLCVISRVLAAGVGVKGQGFLLPLPFKGDGTRRIEMSTNPLMTTILTFIAYVYRGFENVRGETNRQDHGVCLPRVEASESPSALFLEPPAMWMQMESCKPSNCQTIWRSVVYHRLGDDTKRSLPIGTAVRDEIREES